MDYYIIGSKYGENSSKDIFPEMLEKSVVSVGHAWKYDLSDLYGTSGKKIVSYLKEKGENKISCSALKYFLNLKEGDLIAIKRSGSPVGNKPRLIIRGFAIVKEINGKIYNYDRNGLGHQIFVDFIEKNINKEIEFGYGLTIHKLRNSSHIQKIFGAYYEPDMDSEYSRGVRAKNINSHIRTIKTFNLIVDAAHNRLQQELYDRLVGIYGEDRVRMEENFVDLKLIEQDKITFFEVKRYHSARECIREALGQLLDYIWKERKTYTTNLKIVVVGASKPTKDEKRFIDFLKQNLKIEFDYQCLDSII